MGALILVTGGARSGKSSFAEQLAEKRGTSVAYIATAQIFDQEMQYRIDLHRARRPATWQTYEAPFHAERAIRAASAAHGTILFDCVTMYLSNMFCTMTEDDLSDEHALYERVRHAVHELIAAVEEPDGVTAVFVTNEVGAGIVPENRLARRYRDLAGLANQQLAAAANEVYAVICGIPVKVK